jgi:hypothetical protein
VNTQEVIKQKDFAPFRAMVRGIDIALSGATIGLIFAIYIILGGLGFQAQAIGAIATAFVLYTCMERLMKDWVACFVGINYLTLVGALDAAAIASRLPPPIMAYITIWVSTLWLLGMLISWQLFKWGITLFVRFINRRLENIDGEKEQIPPQSQETGEAVQIIVHGG